MTGTGVDDLANPWAAHRRRAEELRVRYPFATEPLGLYLALLDAWAYGLQRAHTDRLTPASIADWATDRMLPEVVKATEAAGPAALAAGLHDLCDSGLAGESMTAWLTGADAPPVPRYAARTCLYPGLRALGPDAGAACLPDPGRPAARSCPTCAGPPQLSYREPAGDALVTGIRRLLCARCGQSWSYSASTCPQCGETAGSARTFYAEQRGGPVIGHATPTETGSTGPAPAEPVTFPHLRIDACTSCHTYLIDVDLGLDGRGVPDVDELVALPLDLYAVEHGLTKITPNVMGF
jgi:FdhE protein